MQQDKSKVHNIPVLMGDPTLSPAARSILDFFVVKCLPSVLCLRSDNPILNHCLFPQKVSIRCPTHAGNVVRLHSLFLEVTERLVLLVPVQR